MTELLTAAQMRAIEQAAIASGEVTGLELMERAGRGVVEAIFEEWPELAQTSHRAMVLCGPGNNGGDGFVVARLLRERGWKVEVFLYGDAEKLPPDAKASHDRWWAENPVSPFSDGLVIRDEDLVIDALFGIGQARALPAFMESFAAHAALVIGIGHARARMVAIDVPSGTNSDTGAPLGQFQFFAGLTVTFHRMKPCHLDDEGAKRCGKTVVKDIGL